jgi:hypothetical protein
MKIPAAAIIVAAILLACGLAKAEPPAPRDAIFYSPNRQFRLAVHPRPIRDPMAYAQKACGAAVEEPSEPARARMERRTGGGESWTRIWAGPLPNEVAPVQALVSDDGKYTITLGNWNSVDKDEDGAVSISFGYWQLLDVGGNIVAIYGDRGRMIRSLALNDLLPSDWIEALQWSASPWGRAYSLSADGSRLVLEIAIPPEEKLGQGDGIEIELDLATGRLVPPGGARWEAALAQAAKVAASARAEKTETAARLLAPLVGPDSADDHDWYVYAVEAFRRSGAEGSPWALVLPARGAPDFAQQAAIIGRVLNEKPDGLNVRLFASPSQEALAELIESAARKVEPGRLKGDRIYVAVSDGLSGRVAAALAHTGAEFIQIDPSKPIPQRPNRLAEEEQLADMFSCVLLGG